MLQSLGKHHSHHHNHHYHNHQYNHHHQNHHLKTTIVTITATRTKTKNNSYHNHYHNHHYKSREPVDSPLCDRRLFFLILKVTCFKANPGDIMFFYHAGKKKVWTLILIKQIPCPYGLDASCFQL